MVPILFGVITIAFFVTRLAGGEPAFLIAGAFSAPEVVANIQEQIGTDKPIAEQYWNFLSGIPKLDFGTSIFTGNPVEEDLGNRLPATLELIVFSLVFALIVGVAAGVFAARRRGKTGDKAVNATSFALLSLPDFWFGLIRLFVFFFKLRWAPAPVGQLSANDPSRSDITGAAVIDSILSANPAALKAAVGHVALPVVALGALLAAPIARLGRDRRCSRCSRPTSAVRTRVRSPPVASATPRDTRVAPPVVTFAGIFFSVLLGDAGSVEAIELAASHPDRVRRLAVVEVPAFSVEEVEEFKSHYVEHPPPVETG